MCCMCFIYFPSNAAKLHSKKAQRGRTISQNDGKDGRDGTGEERGAHGSGMLGTSNAEDKQRGENTEGKTRWK